MKKTQHIAQFESFRENSRMGTGFRKGCND